MENNQVTTYPVLVGKVLSIQRNAMQLDQTTFAEQMGVNQSSWSRIERGVAIINAEQLNKAAQLLHTTAGTLLHQADQLKEAFESQGGQLIEKKETESLSPEIKLVGAAALGALLFALTRK